MSGEGSPCLLWPPGPKVPSLQWGEVHVWAVDLTQVAPGETTLSPAERARAERFHREADRRRFCRTRAALRFLLGGYLGTAPEGLSFALGRRGKPALAGLFTGALHFNAAHGGEVALLAFATHHPVGVDVEPVRTLSDRDALARRFFAPEEAAACLASPPSEGDAAFFRIWTRKEAFLKLLGEGIAFGLKRFAVSAAAGEARLLALDGKAARAAAYRLVHLDPAAGYVGALAFPAKSVTVKCWRLEGT